MAKKRKKINTQDRSSLARDTKNGGKLVSAGGIVSILRDTGTLFNALTVGGVGNKVTDIRNGVSFGFSGANHPPKRVTQNAKTGKKLKGNALSQALSDFQSFGGESISISRLASIHHFGSPSNGLPARPILVRPDAATLGQIRSAMGRAAKKAIANIK